ncbi:hypothetical protein FOZ76_16835 [Verticiella sediminum]|uniref:DUF7064 domain-containing protein n=1 Tax=Verticiella sediminum TaxID=1247510 RepID=A0A556AJL0_9BURK|nr:hypothetical protein [Verticiella sediminum]TSH93050.1 hypothetical protein FOZ76_16835 [Verticiella sediminum]
MYMPPGTRLRLDPRDDDMHVPEPVPNYNESMYVNAFDTSSGVGAWMRLGNRPHEGHAEMTCCVYLPDGRVGFMFRRPRIAGNTELRAGGMHFEVLEPFARLRVHYAGDLLLMDDPRAMAGPRQAFKQYPQRPAQIALDFEGVSPMHGGEIVALDGSPVELDPASAVYRGHTEQNMAVQGHITVDGMRCEIGQGTGYRDKSWGPRYWHGFYWYKWLPITFSRDFGILLSIKGSPGGDAPRVSGNVLRDGVYEPVTGGSIETDYDADGYPRSLVAHVQTASRSYRVSGVARATVPLRHRRADSASYTRITETMAQYACEGHAALGMAEYCDLMNDGMPASALDAAARKTT